MSATQSAKRLRMDLKRIMDDPLNLAIAKPLETNILDWRFVIKGADDSPYKGGVYMGKLLFPPEYPWKPPSILMITPSGRFATGTRICLTISDFHPETWSPSWNISTILVGILSFFNGNESTVGSIEASAEARARYALESIAFNARDKTFVSLFGEDGSASAAFAVAEATIAEKKGQLEKTAPIPASVTSTAKVTSGNDSVFEWEDVAASVEKISSGK